MRKLPLVILFALLAAFGMFSGCSKTTDNIPKKPTKTPIETTDIYLLGAASLTDVLNEVVIDFELIYPEYKIISSYASSGSIQAQIEEGAPGDVFFSAGEKQMKALADGGFVDEENHKNLLENKIVLITPKGNPKGIEGFDDLATDKVELVGVGEFQSVPVGQYSEEILTNMGLLEGLMAGKKIVYGSDVRTVLAWVESGEVDCGLVYKTDALLSDKVNTTMEAPVGTLEKPVIYPVARISHGENPEGGKAFIDFLSTPEASEKFKEYGFSLVEN